MCLFNALLLVNSTIIVWQKLATDSIFTIANLLISVPQKLVVSAYAYDSQLAGCVHLIKSGKAHINYMHFLKYMYALKHTLTVHVHV